MSAPKVSVIIPTYNGAQFLGDAIKSVLGQTYSNFELIVVDDASPDHTNQIVKRFDDTRLKYIVHRENKGSDVARDTGLRASCGEVIAFLDQDDLFHPEKLDLHVAFLTSHPKIGVTYNPRFNLNHSSMTIRNLWCPPRTLTLADLVLGFPLAPSDVVLTRKWALHMDLLKGSLSWCGGEIVHYGDLFLSGCKFAGLERALNYRRHHSGRIIKDLSGGCEAEIYAQDKIFSDPRCPPDVSAIHNRAHANIYLIWAFRAFDQSETDIGREFLREAVRLCPFIMTGRLCELISFLLTCCIDDENRDHDILLGRVLAHLPTEVAHIADQYDQAVAQGYLVRGARAVMWDRPEDGRRHFAHAARLGVVFDAPLASQLAQDLLNYGAEFGDVAAQNKIRALTSHLMRSVGRASARQLTGCYYLNRAFESYRAGEFRAAPKMAMSAVVNEPRYLANRGVISILLRSVFGVLADAT